MGEWIQKRKDSPIAVHVNGETGSSSNAEMYIVNIFFSGSDKSRRWWKRAKHFGVMKEHREVDIRGNTYVEVLNN